MVGTWYSNHYFHWGFHNWGIFSSSVCNFMWRKFNVGSSFWVGGMNFTSKKYINTYSGSCLLVSEKEDKKRKWQIWLVGRKFSYKNIWVEWSLFMWKELWSLLLPKSKNWELEWKLFDKVVREKEED